jgi:hypothetical protein
MNAFRWREDPRPSIFARDTHFTGNRSSGKTQSQTSSEAVQRFTKATGRSPGSIRGISSKGNLLIEEGENRRRAR